MESHNLYRHISTLDTDLYVHCVRNADAPSWDTVIWASIVDRKNHYVYETKEFTITFEELAKWDLVKPGSNK